MSKAVKKKARRLKRTIRKTLGTLFLISALIIAAIPVDNLRAEGEDGISTHSYAADTSVTVKTENPYTIPQMPTDGTAKIYTSADRTVQFVYLPEGSDYCAVIVGYDSGFLKDGTLDFTKKVDAYGQYRINDASGYNYAAVGQQGNFLFYRERKSFTHTAAADVGLNVDEILQEYRTKNKTDYVKEESRVTDPDTQKVTSLVVTSEVGNYLPCFIETYGTWSQIPDEELYWDTTEGNTASPPPEPVYKTVGGEKDLLRIKNVLIKYIGNQYIKTDGNNIWIYGGQVDGTDVGKEHGIFANQNNVKKLIVSNEFKGVGDYAFYNSGLVEIKLENGLQYVGDGAFENCRDLTTADFNVDCNLKVLGAYAFRNCQVLGSFTLPGGVTHIGDQAFAGCMAMTEIDLCSNKNASALKKLGQGVFKDCQSLQSLTFPNNCDSPVYMSSFEGCRSLQWISTRNRNITFPVDDILKYEDFKKMVTEAFFFEGLGNYSAGKEVFTEDMAWDSQVHKLAWKECFAFSYLTYTGATPDTPGGSYIPQDHYELTVKEEKTDEKNTFVVNSNNELEKHVATDGVTELDIPNTIGRQYVATINARVFQDWCELKKVTIPATVTTIKSDAFKGCHNLENVVFASGDIVIEPEAFKTQDFFGNHSGTCTTKDNMTDSNNMPKVKLHFVGPISATSAPFNYAMSSAGRYNTATQKESYIIYYSGSPENLKIEYDPNAVNPNTGVKGMNVLKDFPSLQDLADGFGTDYSYMTDAEKKAASDMVDLYKTNGNTSGMTEQQIDFLNSALNVVIPEGIQAVSPGLFKKKEKANEDVAAGTNVPIDMTVTAYSLATIENARNEDGTPNEKGGTFAGLEHLTSVKLNRDTNSSPVVLEDYAFEGCKNLNDVSMADVASMGKVPFLGCTSLGYVNFQDSTKYVCSDKSIILGLDENGNAYNVIECLEGRASNQRDITTAELGSGITNIEKEAFRNSPVWTIDLSDTNITKIPEGAFAGTEKLTRLTLPEGLELIENFAFAGSNIVDFYVRGKNTICSPFAFYGGTNDEYQRSYNMSELKTPAKDVMWYYAKDGNTTKNTGEAQGFITEETEFPTSYSLRFTYRDEEGNQQEIYGENRVSGMAEVEYPEIPESIVINGLPQRFTEWKLEIEGDVYHFTAMYGYVIHTVTFWDTKDGMKEVYRMEIADTGNALVLAEDIEELAAIMNDSQFLMWDCEGDLSKVTGDFTAVARYRLEGQYLVKYMARKGSIRSPWEEFQTMIVMGGENAPNIAGPTGDEWKVEGYQYTGWLDLPEGISSDETVYAGYSPEQDPDDPDNPNNPDNPNGGTGSGNTTNPPNGGNTNNPGGTGSGNTTNPPNGGNTNNPNGGNNGGSTGSSNSEATKHKLTVQGGSGSGTYAAGEQIIITANAPAKGQEFSSWTVSPASTVVTDKTLSAVIITMPNNDVAAIANYKAKTSTSTGTSNSTGTNRPGSSASNGGSTVVIDKNGLSNTGVVSATVNGSSDNFTIKVTESSAATEAVLKALQAEYGTLDDIKYFPMDISLYDSTGTKKITDTTGLSVSITLPLPDSLITYAGNNKVAGVVNDRLDKLTPRFTTINGVACVTFTAEHFSPYVIYVDITNLSDGTISDSTPTTGDGIHPKWFLSIGLACLSFVMFMVKDNRKQPKKKQKVAVRA